ncbi:ribosomal-processing cysteine protease Prp [Caryophanon tenue]|uniref:Ribosomal processing cysteine protease Prp n=1 Tax=Caryophanon tenue TaxID=33978 RepID=A0A1C0YMN5_9BACL|nr:ribosomal-processing cysteine protease Prp [Caryophanon tenue]OCS88447.1 ribosomal protein [Caryophanon tenue]
MITVTIHSDENRKSYGFDISGHALSDVYGRDLVCAGASAVAFGAVNAIGQLVQITPQIEQGAEGGYLSVQINPAELTEKQDETLQVILNTMVTQFYTMVASYSDYIELKYKMV